MSRVSPGALAFAWFGALLFFVSLAVFLYSYLVVFGATAASGSTARNVLYDVALFSIFALHHTLLARAWAKSLMSRLVSPPLERVVYVWTASLLLLGVCLSWRPVSGELYRVPGSLQTVFFAIQAAGIVVTIRAAADVGVLDLAGLRPLLDRSGTEAGATAGLRTSGLYGLVRHPLYFAWVLFVFGTPHMTMTRFVFAAVSTAYLALAIPFEERGLVSTFGSEYRAYRAKVRWRMLPGLY